MHPADGGGADSEDAEPAHTRQTASIDRAVRGRIRRAAITAEVCEDGAKAVAEDAPRQRASRDLFAQYSVADLAEHSEYWIGKGGRLTEAHAPARTTRITSRSAGRRRTTTPPRSV